MGVLPGDGGSADGGAVGVTKDSELALTDAGLTSISLGGYLNGESFQQEGLLSLAGYQYAAFWNAARHVVLARRPLPAGDWQIIELADYTNVDSDARSDVRSAISLGICPGDGTLHVAFDNKQSALHYRKSTVGLVTSPATAMWAASSFSSVTSELIAGSATQNVNYPGFVTEPGGTKMLMDMHTATGNGGDETLWEYDGTTHAWSSVGMILNGTARAYLHGFSYTRGASRLHISWSWRTTNDDPSTNHDLQYAYSDDDGRTWKNNGGATVATAGTSFITVNSVGIKVWAIGPNRGLINSEHMAVDSAGRVHVLLSHLPDAQADDAVFDSARSKSQYFHYWRNGSGTWARTAMAVNAVATFRGKLAVSSKNNLYAVLPDLNIAQTSAAANFAGWTVFRAATAGRFFSDPLIDSARLLVEDKLTVVYPEKGSPGIYVLDFTIK